MSQSLHRVLNGLAGVAVLAGGAGTFLQFSMYTVEPGHRAVIFDRFKGVKDTVIGEGTKLRIPWVQTPYIYDVRITASNIRSDTGCLSKDLQTIGINLRVLYKPDRERLPEIYRQYGLDYADRVLPSVGNEVLKQIVAQYDASELITQRELVSREVREELTARANKFNIVLDDVAITHLSFSHEYAASIERKQVAQQEAERSKYVVAKSEQEKKASITKAEGEAEAARLISEAMANGPGFIELRRIQASRDIAETLSHSPNVSFLPSGGNLLLNLPGR